MSIAVCPSSGDVFVGNNATVTRYVGGKAVRWEWVTRLADASGGAYDGPANDMVCDSQGNLFVANDVSLNVRRPDGVVEQVDFSQGMPMNLSTTLALEPGTEALWIGGPIALLRWSRGQDEDDWRYFHGDRFLPHTSNITVLLSLDGSNTVAATTGGVVRLEWQLWTLAEKAAHYEAILLARHNRHGLVGECDMASYGALSTCVGGPNDNSGLWTSLVVAGMAQAYHLAPAPPERLALLETFFAGMELLVNITGIQGLMGRTCVAPGEPYPTSDPDWHNTTDPRLQGWHFKGDASSDEVVGHMFAHAVTLQVLSESAAPPVARARQLLVDIVTYIVRNHYFLIDVTGNHTRWGVWSPEYINGQ